MITQKQRNTLKMYYTAIQASYKWKEGRYTINARGRRASGSYGHNIGLVVQFYEHRNYANGFLQHFTSNSIEGRGKWVEAYCKGANDIFIKNTPKGLLVNYFDKDGAQLDYYYL